MSHYKVGLAFSSKNRVELTRQTFPRALEADVIVWADGSTDDDALAFFASHSYPNVQRMRVVGGADYAILFGLQTLLSDASLTHVGLLENDVLLPEGWLEETMQLFEQKEYSPGAVTARVYSDRILLQPRPEFAILHNAGAGHIIFTRKAAELVVEHYRTGWWPDNRAVFSALSGLDIGRWACFRNNVQPITADWHFDTVLAAHGLSTLGPTPSRVQMIGQNPSLEEQGLELATGANPDFNRSMRSEFKGRIVAARYNDWLRSMITPWQRGAGNLYFAHQLHTMHGGTWETVWKQGFGPFAFRAVNDTVAQVRMVGPVSFFLSPNGTSGRIELKNLTTGYETSPHLDAEAIGDNAIIFDLPGEPIMNHYEMTLPEGMLFHGIRTPLTQPWSRIMAQVLVLPPPYIPEN